MADGALLRIEPTVDGQRAFAVARPPSHGLELAALLTSLSEGLWRGYTHPPGAAGDDLAPNTEGWRRQHERDVVAELEETLSAVYQPANEAGVQFSSYVFVEEVARRIARTLSAIGDPSVREAVVAEVRAEIDAVAQAEAGDLRGRSAQALLLSRSTTNPLHVVAAQQALAVAVNGGDALRAIDPAAAAVACARFLHAAAELASDVSGVPVTRVVDEEDNIEAMPTVTATYVLEQLDLGQGPEAVVHGLLADALAIAEGAVLDVDELIERLTIDASDHPYLSEDDLEVLRAEQRLCLLDPRRPAPDLLEDLLEGIRGCWLLWSDFTGDPDADESSFWARVVSELHPDR
jgi:hypothetical protein